MVTTCSCWRGGVRAGDGPAQWRDNTWGYWRWWQLLWASASFIQRCCGNGWSAYHSLTVVPWCGPTGPVVGCLPCYQVSFWRMSFVQMTMSWACTVRCQSKSQGSRYCLGLIVYDIVAGKIFDRYRNIALSIRAPDWTTLKNVPVGLLFCICWQVTGFLLLTYFFCQMK